MIISNISIKLNTKKKQWLLLILSIPKIMDC